MKLLMTADTVGGVWTYAIDLCHELSFRGVSVTLVTMGRRMSEAQRTAAEDIRGLSVVETELRLEWMSEPWDDVARANDLVWELARELQPDVVHLNTYAQATLPWERLGVPTLLVGHSCVGTWWWAVKGEPCGPEWGRYLETVGEAIHSADVFVTPTRAMLDAACRCYGEPGNARVIPNGRDATLHAPAWKDPLVLAAGRVWDEAKNVTLLERAASRIHWPVFIAGETEPFKPLSRDVNALGPLSPQELAAWMGRASVYVLPARYEPFGLSALEAAMSGCALVLGDIPTLREVWGDAAVYVDPGDDHALADTVNRLMRLGDERRRLAHDARRRARRYTAQAMADAYLQAYRSLAASPARSDEPTQPTPTPQALAAS